MINLDERIDLCTEGAPWCTQINEKTRKINTREEKVDRSWLVSILVFS